MFWFVLPAWHKVRDDDDDDDGDELVFMGGE